MSGNRGWGFRVANCYCALPPSIHPDGPTYAWIIPPTENIPIIDPLESGFEKRWGQSQDFTQHTQQTKQTQQTHSIEGKDNSVREKSVTVEIRPCGIPLDVLKLIHSELPQRPGERNRRIFRLARKLARRFLGRPDQELKPYLQEWFRLAHSKTSGEHGWDDCWLDFQIAWENVLLPDGTTFDDLMAEVILQPLPHVALTFKYEHPKIRKLLALCRLIQRRCSSEREFYLSCRLAGRLLQVSHVQANHWLKLLVNSGVLKLTQQGGPATYKASHYRYLGEM